MLKIPNSEISISYGDLSSNENWDLDASQCPPMNGVKTLLLMVECYSIRSFIVQVSSFRELKPFRDQSTFASCWVLRGTALLRRQARELRRFEMQ